MQPYQVEKAFAGWVEAGILDDARVAGRLECKTALLEVVRGGETVLPGARTQAAGRILDRVEHVKGLGKDVEQHRRRFTAASEAQLRQMLRELQDDLGLEDPA